MPMAKTGVLLINIGSPRSYKVPDVQRYLKTFLMDEDIISIPKVFRWLLVHGVIVPRRASYSAANYKKIWLKEGSPLTVYTQRFAEKLQQELGSHYSVKVGMRYSDPSIENALKEFREEGLSELLLVPLYPQYAEATTGSSLKEVRRLTKKHDWKVQTRSLNFFFSDRDFIRLSSEKARSTLAGQRVDHYLFSFHGLPESQVKKVAGCLQQSNCCEQQGACEKPCYRAQCHATASLIAQELGLPRHQWSVSFQSRLGRAEWLKPSTDSILDKLGREGKSLAVLCPSFTADCIETLEEIGMGGAEEFKAAGGKEFYLVPCFNDDHEWAQSFAQTLQVLRDKGQN